MTTGSRDIGGYVGAELIGRGGFSAVYRAVDPRHGRDVAIKVIQGAMGEAERRRFDRECQAMGRLGGHPNIAAVYESGYTPDGEGYLVMELATGGSLGDRLAATGPLPWTEVVALGVVVAGALQFAHDQGVLHRDVKPENILVDRFGAAKLSDFGIAVMTGNATVTANSASTLAHTAPELLEGRAPTTAVDVYALGSTLHTLLSGMPPFQRAGDETVGPLVTRTLSEPPPDLRPLGVPDPVAAVIERALAKDPAHRPATAAAMAAELQAAGQIGGATATRSLAEPATNLPGAGADIGAGAGIGAGASFSTGAGADVSPGYRAEVVSGPGPLGNRTALITALIIGGAMVTAVVVAALVLIVLTRGGGSGDDTDPTDNPPSTTASTLPATTTTRAPTTSPTTVVTTPPAPTVRIDCPASVPVRVRTDCTIVSADASRGTYEIPGFTDQVIELLQVPGNNGIFLEPLDAGAVGRSFTITATVVSDDGRQATAQHTFVLTS